MQRIVLLLVILNGCFYTSFAVDVLEVVPGVFSARATSDGLDLPATTTFKQINNLQTNLHLGTDCTVFIYYQMTLQSESVDFHSKLVINNYNSGSLVHSGVHKFKSPTGFYMANLEAGDYNIQVQYKSPKHIKMDRNWDWQSAVLQIMAFEDAHAVSDGIKCYPAPTATNNYNNWRFLPDMEVSLYLPNKRAILSAYQLSTEMSSRSHVVTSLNVNGFHQQSASFVKGDNDFLDLHGAWAQYYPAGIHSFNVMYRSPAKFSFTDCQQNYTNKNLYAMVLPESCRVATITPTGVFTLRKTSQWASTDVNYTLTLDKKSHVLVMYQYSGFAKNSYVLMRLSINSVPCKHTQSLTGDTEYAGNFGLWQGSLNAGTHSVVLEYRSPVTTKSGVIPVTEWRPYVNKWENRAMSIIIC